MNADIHVLELSYYDNDHNSIGSFCAKYYVHAHSGSSGTEPFLLSFSLSFPYSSIPGSSPVKRLP